MGGGNLSVSSHLHLVSKNFDPSEHASRTDSPKVHPQSPSPRAPLAPTNEALAGTVDLILHALMLSMPSGESRSLSCLLRRYRGELEDVSETRSRAGGQPVRALPGAGTDTSSDPDGSVSRTLLQKESDGHPTS